MQRIFNKNFSWNLTESNQKKKYFGHFHSCKESFFFFFKIEKWFSDKIFTKIQKWRKKGNKIGRRNSIKVKIVKGREKYLYEILVNINEKSCWEKCERITKIINCLSKLILLLQQANFFLIWYEKTFSLKFFSNL